MKIILNSKEQIVDEGISVDGLAAQLGLPQGGVAIAVNNRIVKRDEWKDTLLKENDSVIIIKAACGG